MSWIPLSFSVPLISAFKTIGRLNPKSYDEYETADVSSYENIVRDVALRILHAESAAGRKYAERIKDMIEDLPQHVTARNIESLFAARIKVAKHNHQAFPIHVAGTDIDVKPNCGKYYIAINPMGKDGSKEREVFEKALPWMVAHEMRHVLEDDQNTVSMLKTIASFSTCSLISVAFGYGFPAAAMSAVAALGVNVITHSLLSKYYENKADVFANQHTTIEDRQKAVEWLELIKQARPPAGILEAAGSVLHQKEDVRLQNIIQSCSQDLKKTA